MNFGGGGQPYSMQDNVSGGFLANCDITIYPEEYFLPDWHKAGESSITDKTAVIHWENNSWCKGLSGIKKKKLSVTGFSPLRKFYHKSKIFRYECLNRIKNAAAALAGKSLQ